MRYIKVLLLVLVFFLCMVFFFQNQEALSKEMVLKLHLFFTPPMASIPLPLYFLVLAAFLMGALLSILMLAWDKMHLSARLMKATWRVRALEKEAEQLKNAMGPSAARGFKLFSRAKVAKPGEAMEAKAVEAASVATTSPAAVDDVTAPDPDKHA